MSNSVYPQFMRAMAAGELGDVTAATWSVTPLSASAAYDPTDAALTDLSASIVGDSVVMPSVAIVVSGEDVRLTCDTDPPLELTGVTSIEMVAALAVSCDGALAAWIDRRGDTSPITLTGTGADIPLSFPFGWFIQI